MVQKGIFWNIGEHFYFVYYNIISYQRIKVYRVEKWIREYPTGTIVSVGRLFWNNDVSGKYNPSK